MPLPLSFVLGLFCLIASSDAGLSLPRPIDLGPVLPYLALVMVPSVLVVVTTPRSFGGLNERRLARRLRIGAVVPLLAIPVAYWLILVTGEWSAWVDQQLPSLLFVATAVKLIPLWVMEITVHVARFRAAERSPQLSMGPPPFHLALVTFLSVMVLIFAGAVDLASLRRGASVFLLHTSVGNQAMFLALTFGLCAVAPGMFRFLTQPIHAVPEDALETAGALGFPRRDVQLLRTGNRLVNAMLVGPVPGLRYLFVTDGLVAMLDPLSLRGVVAHEVGHARANHPLLLVLAFGGLPLLLFYPLEVVGISELGWSAVAVIAAFGLVLGVMVIRRIAHRFELEADLLSADALGGSGPCILALHKVSQIAGGKPDRATMRHPSEESRILHLLSCEGDPWFRERFERGGRQLRYGMLAVIAGAAVLCAWAHVKLWPVDKAVYQYLTGQFPAATASLESIPADISPGRRGFVEQLRLELAAARSLLPEGGDWEAIRGDLAERAARQGRRELLRNGPRAARPWYAVAMSKVQPTPLELSLYLYCEAMSHEDPARSAELREHLLRSFDLDPDLASALRAG